MPDIETVIKAALNPDSSPKDTEAYVRALLKDAQKRTHGEFRFTQDDLKTLMAAVYAHGARDSLESFVKSLEARKAE